MVDVGVILVTIFSIACFGIFVQILAAIMAKRKLYRMVNEGYYFLEVRVRWGRKELRPIHPNEVDLSTGVPRLRGNIVNH